MPSRSEDEQKVCDWGFSHVFTWTDGPNAYYPPHSHAGLTTHLVRTGSLTITYPKDAEPKKMTYGPGARIDVDAGRVHEVWMGSQGGSGDDGNDEDNDDGYGGYGGYDDC